MDGPLFYSLHLMMKKSFIQPSPHALLDPPLLLSNSVSTLSALACEDEQERGGWLPLEAEPQVQSNSSVWNILVLKLPKVQQREIKSQKTWYLQWLQRDRRDFRFTTGVLF